MYMNVHTVKSSILVRSQYQDKTGVQVHVVGVIALPTPLRLDLYRVALTLYSDLCV